MIIPFHLHLNTPYLIVLPQNYLQPVHFFYLKIPYTENSLQGLDVKMFANSTRFIVGRIVMQQITIKVQAQDLKKISSTSDIQYNELQLLEDTPLQM